MRDKNKKIKFFAFTILEEIYIIYRGSGGIFPYWRTVRCFFTIFEEELEKYEPSLDVEQVSEVVNNNNNMTDVTDIMRELIAEAKGTM